MVAIMFWMSALPVTTEFMMQVVPQLLENRKNQAQSKQGMFFDEQDENEEKPIDFGFENDDDDDD